MLFGCAWILCGSFFLPLFSKRDRLLSESRNFMGLGDLPPYTAMFKHTRGGVGGYRLRIIIELCSFIRKTSFQSYVLTIELTNKYVLGGSSGIGRGAVLLLSKLGCSVAFGGRNKTELDNVAAKCKEARSDAQVINLFPPKRHPVIK